MMFLRGLGIRIAHIAGALSRRGKPAERSKKQVRKIELPNNHILFGCLYHLGAQCCIFLIVSALALGGQIELEFPQPSTFSGSNDA